MNCEQTNNMIQTVNLDNMHTALNQEATLHIEGCEQCKNSYERHIAYLTKMKNVTTPNLHPTRAANMLHKVAENHAKSSKATSGFIQGFIAASVMAISLIGAVNIINKPNTPKLVNTIAPEFIDQNVTIVIHSKTDLYDAELDLMLPQQIEIAGLENIQQLTWPVDLKSGANTLELPIRVNMNKAIEQPLSIMATLYHEDEARNFEVNIELNQRS